MKRLALVSIAMLLVLVSAPTVAAQDVDDDPAALADLAEQIEIMKLVLTSSINTRFEKLIEQKRPAADERRDDGDEPITDRDRRRSPDVETPASDPASVTYESALLALSRAAGTQDPGMTDLYLRTVHTSHTRGFYAQDLGVLFSGEVLTPLRPIVSSEPDDDPDEWDVAARRLRGTGQTSRARRSGRIEAWEIDIDFVDAAVSAVLATLGKYGHKLEDLPDDERLIVALRLTPGGVTAGRAASPFPAVATLFDQPGGTARAASVVHLVIEVRKRDVARATGRNTAEIVRNLREEAKITWY